MFAEACISEYLEEIGSWFGHCMFEHYENMPIQVCTKFHLQKLKIFR